MFGFLKRSLAGNANRVANYASGLAQVAQIMVYMALMNYFKTKNPATDEDSQSQIAAAWANYLFGQEPSELHAHLNLEVEHAKALDWLENEGSDFREIVIQGLRISNTADYAKTGNANLRGIELLEKFGGQYPDAPDLEKYAASLLLMIVGRFEPGQKESIFRFIRTGPFASNFKNSKYFGWD